MRDMLIIHSLTVISCSLCVITGASSTRSHSWFGGVAHPRPNRPYGQKRPKWMSNKLHSEVRAMSRPTLDTGRCRDISCRELPRWLRPDLAALRSAYTAIIPAVRRDGVSAGADGYALELRPLFAAR